MEIRDLTIGIEEEYQIIDPDTRELTSYITEMLDQGAILFRDQVKPEALQPRLQLDQPQAHAWDLHSESSGQSLRLHQQRRGQCPDSSCTLVESCS